MIAASFIHAPSAPAYAGAWKQRSAGYENVGATYAGANGFATGVGEDVDGVVDVYLGGSGSPLGRAGISVHDAENQQ